MEISVADRVLGGLYGLLVGDAVGVPYALHDPVLIPDWDQIDMEAPAGFIASYSHVPPGTWSGCGANALALLDSLLGCQLMHPGDFASRLNRWATSQAYAPGGELVAPNKMTLLALKRVQGGIALQKAGGEHPWISNNGSLTRVLPLALWHQGPDAQLMSNAMTQSSVSHNHLRSMAGCAFYSLWAKELLTGKPAQEGWDAALARFRKVLPPRAPSRRHLEEKLFCCVDDEVEGGEFLFSSLLAARWLLDAHDSYEDVVRGAISLGHDTNGLGAIGGGLAGIIYGREGIPKRWLGRLRGREIVDPLADQLIEAIGQNNVSHSY